MSERPRPTVLALMNEAEKLARVADEISAQYALELALVLRDLELELRRLTVEALEGNRTALSRAVRAARLRRLIQRALKAAGYERLAGTATAERLDRLVAQLEKLRLAAKLKAFTSTDVTRILALKELARLDLLGQGEAIAQAIWRTLAQGIFSARPVDELLEDLSDALDLELREARTLYDTAISVFGRQLEALKARDRDVYAYMGPADVKLRPFCREHVGKVYTKAEIDALDNGQMPNVFLTGGGWNCRHTFIAVSRLSALRELVGTGQRMPEVERQLVAIGTRRAA